MTCTVRTGLGLRAPATRLGFVGVIIIIVVDLTLGRMVSAAFLVYRVGRVAELGGHETGGGLLQDGGHRGGGCEVIYRTEGKSKREEFGIFSFVSSIRLRSLSG